MCVCVCVYIYIAFFPLKNINNPQVQNFYPKVKQMLSSSSLDRTVLWHDTGRQDFLPFYLEFAIWEYHDSKTSKVVSYNSPHTMLFSSMCSTPKGRLLQVNSRVSQL